MVRFQSVDIYAIIYHNSFLIAHSYYVNLSLNLDQYPISTKNEAYSLGSTSQSKSFIQITEVRKRCTANKTHISPTNDVVVVKTFTQVG